MTAYDDAESNCPECSRPVDLWQLCSCDDPETGPLCGTCCERWHEGVAA